MSGVAFVPKEIIDRFPEINPVNYDPNDAIALNDWGIEVVLASRGSADIMAALKEAQYFIQAPAEDLKDGVLSRIREAIAKTGSTPPPAPFAAGFREAARLIDLDALTAEQEKITLTPSYLKALAETLRNRAE